MPINPHHNPTNDDDDDNDGDIDALIAVRRYKQSTAPPPSSLQERTAPLPFNRQDFDDMRDLIILSLLSRLVLDNNNNNARRRNVRILNTTKQRHAGRHNALFNKRRQ